MRADEVDDWASAARLQQQFLERLAELDVEDGVDERIEEAIDVAEPDEQRERQRMNVAEAERRKQVVADADGAHDVDGEKRNPAEQKHSCRQILRRQPQIIIKRSVL